MQTMERPADLMDRLEQDNERWLAQAARAKARLLSDPNRPAGLRDRISREEAQELAHPKQATCPRCRDLRHRRVQVGWQYQVAALCPCCWKFVVGAMRRRGR